ncbi:MAG: ATP-binding cassette domain-containing protein [Candidatus Lokiarchaeota archaeon]|nr:ATP-binding cassette domain-containing protein [Candidatus Lokiarchaeota archaeon]
MGDLILAQQNHIETDNLTKRFGELVAADRINIEIPKGSVFGLLGPNGAGKSTTVRLLCTLLKPDRGSASVCGYDVVSEPVRVREITGVLPEEGNHTHYETLSAYENLLYFARLYGLEENRAKERIHELLQFMELWERRNDLAGKLSTGNRQRLALCRALIHEPKVLLLDEPTSALDPVAAKRVRKLILDLSAEYGQTFLLNSHNLAEVDRICDHIAIIDEGKILVSGKTDELRNRLRRRQYYRLVIGNEIEAVQDLARDFDFILSVENQGNSLILEIENPRENNPVLLRSLLKKGIDVIELAEEETTLEDLYLSVIKEDLSE